MRKRLKREGVDFMIIRSGKGTRGDDDLAKKEEGKRVEMLNREFFQNVQLTKEENDVLVWLCGWDEWTVGAMVGVFRKIRG